MIVGKDRTMRSSPPPRGSALQDEIDRALGAWARGAAGADDTLHRLIACVDADARSVAVVLRTQDGAPPTVHGGPSPDLARALARGADGRGRLLLSSRDELDHALPASAHGSVGWVAIEPLEESLGVCIALGDGTAPPGVLLALPALAQAVAAVVARKVRSEGRRELRHELNNCLCGVTNNLGCAVEMVDQALESASDEVAAARLWDLRLTLLHASASAIALGRRTTALLEDGTPA